jgi:PAS domain-containing protein
MNCPENSLIKAMPSYAWMKDCQGQYIYVNPAFCTALGCVAEDVLGKTATSIWGDATAARLAIDEARVISTRLPLSKQDVFSLEASQVGLNCVCFLSSMTVNRLLAWQALERI